MITQNDITISNVYVTENSADSSVVAVLGVENAGGGTPVFTLLDDAGGRFELFNNAGVWEVRVADGSLLDAEQDLQHRISVLVDDGAGGTRSEAFTLAVRDAADPFRGLGNDFLINTTTSGFQTKPSVTGLENGNFVAAWADFSGTDGSASGIRGRLFTADGSPLNNDFIINSTTTGDQLEPDVTSLENGGFVVTWRDDNATDGSGSSIRGRVYAANGTPADDDFIINTTTTGDQLDPSVTDLADGGFIVTWRDDSGTDGSGPGIRGRIFAADGTPEDDDFIINTTTANEQLQSSVTGLSDGNFVATWTDFSGTDGAGSGIRGRLFAVDGTPIDGDFIINSSTAGFQLVPSVTSLSNGGFVVTWRDENGTDGSDFGIQGRIFAADGTPAGNDFVVNTTTNGNQFVASVTGLASGGFVVTWSDDGGADGSGSGIRGRAFAADGTPVGDDFFVNTTTADDQYQPSVAALADGGFVVTWRDDSGADGSISAIQGRVFAEDGSLAVFGVEGGNIARDSAAGTVVASLTGAGFSFSLTDDADGRFELAGNQIVVAAGANLDLDSAAQYFVEIETTDGLGNARIERLPVFVEDPSGPAFGVSPEFLVNTTTLNGQINPSAAGLADGSFVVTWSDASGTDGSGLGIRGRVFSADGTPAGDDFIVNTTTADTQIDPSVTGLANGSFVAMWSDAGGADGANSGIIGRIFAADGTPAGDDFVVNSTTASFQSEASVTGLVNGGFVATWRDDGATDGSGSGIQGRIFAADGTPAGNDFVVNTTTAGNQQDPSSTSLVNGSFVVTWRDNNGADGSDSGVFGRVFAADGTPLGDDFIVNTTTASFQIEPSVTGLANGGFVVTWRDNSGTDGSSSGIQGRLFAEDGTPAGDDFIVNSTTDSFQIEPSVTGLADGGFVVTWRDGSGTDGSGSGIRGRAFTPDGRPVGDDFIVNTTTASNQEEPSVTALANGGFVVAWRDAAGDGSSSGIRAQVFAVGSEVTANAQVLGTSGNDVQLEGSEFKDDIFGLAGNDIASGKAGDDRLFGAEGDDRLRGDEGNDLLSGGSGADLLEGDSENARDHYDAQTFRMYQAGLDRQPDAVGLEFWASGLFDGTETVLTMADGFVTSTEFVTTYGTLDNSQFVNLLYNNVLGRDADTGGLAFWLNELSTGASRAEVLAGFSESREFVDNTQETNASFLSSGIPIALTDDVYRLYRATLDRDPDVPGLLGWLTSLGDGTTKQQVADGFVSSSEFQSVYGALDDTAFITLLYSNVLDRDADAPGLAFWLNEISSGATRADVVLGFSDSLEFVDNTEAGANAWVRSADLGNDVLFGGADDDRMFGGLGADSFVFDASLDGADFVGDLERWDTLVFNGFSYTSKEDVLAHVTQVGTDALFSDQGNTVTFYNTTVADLDHADMFSFDDTSLLS